MAGPVLFWFLVINHHKLPGLTAMRGLFVKRADLSPAGTTRILRERTGYRRNRLFPAPEVLSRFKPARQEKRKQEF
jgi:hypothetical protein